MKHLPLIFVAACGLAWPQARLNPNPSRVVGHPQIRLMTDQPNLVEGRELNTPRAVAVDTSVNPPALFVADTNNNRVLGFRNASNFENGVPADLVIGQRDRFSTGALGPGTSLSSGLAAPAALAVDAAGRLYVVDAGNNRILRYPRPFAQPAGDLVQPDMVIGQANFSTRTPNTGGISERSIATTAPVGGTQRVFGAGLAFDRDGHLWFTDPANHRVLRYPSASLAGGANQPSADIVLGQPDFNTGAPLAVNLANRINRSRMNAPASLAFDNGGRLFVADQLNRVLVYVGPFVSGMDAQRYMGIPTPPAPGQPALQPINEQSLGLILVSGTTTTFLPPDGVFTIGDVPFVVDTPAHRILRYDPFPQWSPDLQSPPARAVIGQDTLGQDSPRPNRGSVEPGANTLASPVSALFANTEVFVVDSQNHRVLVFPDLTFGPPISSGAPYLARRVVGQTGFEFRSVNFIEGREFFFRGGLITAAGVAVDSNSNPPRLYVADTNNHRVLGFADARRVRPGDRADIVLGQPDFLRSIVNYPPNDTAAPSETALAFPAGIAVDAAGNVWVADQGNARIVRFPNPFTNPQRPARADLVIGQASFTSRLTDPSARTMAQPFGLAFTVEGHLLASDSAHHRVLLFEQPFSNGMTASRVFGQPDFTSSGTGATPNRMNNPRHISTDTDDRLYVADAANNRVLIFSRAVAAGPDPAAVLVLSRNLRTPHAVAVGRTGEIWVGNSGTNGTFRYPQFATLQLTGDLNDDTIALPTAPSVTGALALALDFFGNLYIADSASRVGIHYPGMATVNAASNALRVAPGMIATIYRQGPEFTDQTLSFDALPNPVPLPKELADVQVLVNDVPAPLYFVSPGQINFLVPSSTAINTTAEIQVVQPSTGRILAASTVAVVQVSPGLFSNDGSGTGQLAALNEDNTRNGPPGGALNAQPIQRGRVIQLFGTGQGVVPGAPPDGELATGPLESPIRPRVFVNTQQAGALIECQVTYSGLAPGLVGVWQINAMIPATVPPNNASGLTVILSDVASPPAGAPAAARTTIAIRQ
jgi:uncharacterized protein (TIGR03437 family)